MTTATKYLDPTGLLWTVRQQLADMVVLERTQVEIRGYSVADVAVQTVCPASELETRYRRVR